MNYNEFAETVKAKYPEYKDVDNQELAQKVVAKYPEYQSVVDFTAIKPEDPGLLKSAAAGIMSGIPGAETAVSGIQAIGDKTYEEAHKDLEDLKNAAWEQHPVAYGAGKTAGFVGTGLTLPVTGTLAGAAATGAALGAASGLDTSATPTDMPMEALKGAGTGALTGGVLHGAGKVLESLPSVSKNVLGSLGKETSKEGVESYLANPEAINAAPSGENIANKVADLTNDITKASGHLSESARSVLSPTENPLNIKNIKDAAMEATQKYFTEGNPATAADETSIKAIIDQYQKLANIAESNNGVVPETTLRSMIDRLQAATKESTYGNPEASASQRALKEMSGKLNDLLRKANPEYAEAMAPSAEAAQLSSDLQSQFKLENGQPTNTTAGQISNLLKEGKPETQALAEKLKNMTGTDIQELMKNSKLKESFNALGAGGALKTLMSGLGFGVGKMTGIPFAGIGGAGVGRYASEAMNGGQIAKSILDAYISGSKAYSNSAIAPLLAKFGPVLVNAAKVGGNQLAATHFVLATSNPEYQTLANHMQDNSDTEENTGIKNQE